MIGLSTRKEMDKECSGGDWAGGGNGHEEVNMVILVYVENGWKGTETLLLFKEVSFLLFFLR